MKAVLIGAAAVAASMLSPVRAATAQPSTDVSHALQCFLLGGSLINNSDEKIKSVGMITSMFYAGQVFAIEPNIDLTAAMRREAPKITEARLPALRTECSTELQRRGAQMSAAGQALQADAAKK